MNDYPTLERTEYTHEAIVTFEGQEPRKIRVIAWNNYDAFTSALRQLFGDDRDQVMPPMIIVCRKIEFHNKE